jgi:hypothetical protein
MSCCDPPRWSTASSTSKTVLRCYAVLCCVPLSRSYSDVDEQLCSDVPPSPAASTTCWSGSASASPYPGSACSWRVALLLKQGFFWLSPIVLPSTRQAGILCTGIYIFEADLKYEPKCIQCVKAANEYRSYPRPLCFILWYMCDSSCYQC